MPLTRRCYHRTRGCVSMGSAEPMEFLSEVPEPMDFEQIVKQMQQNQTFETYISLKIK